MNKIENNVKNKFNILSLIPMEYESEIDELKKERSRSTFEKRYIGEFKHDFKHGLGIMKFSNGDIYEGEFRNDKRNGIGKYIFLTTGHDCLLYIGEFSNDTMSGEGKMIFKNGSIFDGKFKNNKMPDEDAIFKYANGDIYHGGIANNLKHSKDAEYIYSENDQNRGLLYF